MLEKGDFEVHPDSVNEPQNETIKEKSLRVLSKTKSATTFKDPGPPPDGGALAWTQVLSGHLIVLNTWGCMNSFGVFQTYYVDFLGHSDSDVAWIGSIQVFLTFFIGTFTGRLTDAGYFRPVFAIGTVFSVLGLFMASISTQWWQIFLAQGVCCGLGNGFLFCPMLSVVSTYFSKRKSLAVGICACGGATGGLIFPAMVQQLIPTAGYGWTMRALGFVTLVCVSICNILARPRVPPRKTGPIVEFAAFTEPPYALFAIAMFFVFWGVYFASYFVGSFGVAVIGLPQSESINLLLVLNGVGIIGRTVPAYVANHYVGPMNTLLLVTIASVVCSYAMIGVTTRGGFYAWTVVYGIMGNAVQGMFPVVLSSLTSDLSKAGVRMGMIFVSARSPNAAIRCWCD
ncbi:transporter MCH4-like protein 6 [Phlyctema vagabunda]|uniref:Transporter MCH4-like protein 6 n=1 Tax=Phlyctema vagabunda TaxID=108571 RepID=A0ABR4PUG2_9HELO